MTTIIERLAEVLREAKEALRDWELPEKRYAAQTAIEAWIRAVELELIQRHQKAHVYHDDRYSGSIPLYACPQSIEITDEMVERACVAAYHGTWHKLPAVSKDYRRACIGRALRAALEKKP